MVSVFARLAALLICINGLPAFAQTAPQLPVPQTRPEAAGVETQTRAETEPEEPPTQAGPAPLSPTDIAACETAMTRLGATFEVGAPAQGEGGCGVARPYILKSVAGSVTVSPETTLRCPAALALAGWITGEVIPAARQLTGEAGKTGGLTEVRTAATYVCRRRNNLPTGEISEHGFGNAVDIVVFGFEGRAPLAVKPRTGDAGMPEAFQRAVRAGACLHFTTVLGPGSDAYHDDHLHMDLAERSSGYRLCQ